MSANYLQAVLKIVVPNLIRNRDLMGVQLNYHFKNISYVQKEEQSKKLLIETETMELYVLKKYVETLFEATGRVFISEEISTMFNCDIATAEKAIELIIKEKRDEKILSN